MFDNLDRDEEVAVKIDAAIRHVKKAGWRGNLIKEREVRAAIRHHVADEARIDAIFDLVKKQDEY